MVAVVRKTRATREQNLILVKAGDQVCRMSHWAQQKVESGGSPATVKWQGYIILLEQVGESSPAQDIFIFRPSSLQEGI